MKHIPLVLAVFVALTACQSQPDEIEAAFVPVSKYQHLDCEQLAAETDRMRERLLDLYHHIEESWSVWTDERALYWAFSTAPWILVDMLYFSPKVGGEEKRELSVLKGEFDSLRQNVLRKGCSFSPASPDEVSPEPPGSAQRI